MKLSHLLGNDDLSSDDGCRIEQAAVQLCSRLSSATTRWDGAARACSMQSSETVLLFIDVVVKDTASPLQAVEQIVFVSADFCALHCSSVALSI